MKQKIPTSVAAAVIVLCTVGLLLAGWKWMGGPASVNSDVRNMVSEMNRGKVQTEPVDPGDDLFLAGGRQPAKAALSAKEKAALTAQTGKSGSSNTKKSAQ